MLTLKRPDIKKKKKKTARYVQVPNSAAGGTLADRRFQNHFTHQQPPRSATGKTREAARRREHPRVPAISRRGHLSGAPPSFALQGVSVVSSPFTVLCHLRGQETGKANSRPQPTGGVGGLERLGEAPPSPPPPTVVTAQRAPGAAAPQEVT